MRRYRVRFPVGLMWEKKLSKIGFGLGVLSHSLIGFDALVRIVQRISSTRYLAWSL